MSVRAPVGDLNVAEGDLAIGRGIAILRGDSNTLTVFLGIALTHSKTELIARSGTGMFSSITKDGLSGLPIQVPCIEEQRRIVDLIEAIDVMLVEVQRTAETADILYRAYLREAFALEGIPVRRLGELVEMRSGPSWKASQESSTAAEGAVPVLSIKNTLADGGLDLTDRTFVSGLPPSTTRLDESSLVLIRTNGNRSRIGNVYRATTETVDHAVSAFLIAILPHDPRDSDYLYRYLQSEPVQIAISDAASGSTALGNIALGWLRQLEIPWMNYESRQSIVQLADTLAETCERARVSLQAGRQLRNALIVDLLSGDHPIPDAYDEFLGA